MKHKNMIPKKRIRRKGPFVDVTRGYDDLTIVNSSMVLNIYSLKVCIHLKPTLDPNAKIISSHFSDKDVLSLECSQKTTIGDVKSYIDESYDCLKIKNLLCYSGEKADKGKRYKPKNAHFITTNIESNRKRH